MFRKLFFLVCCISPVVFSTAQSKPFIIGETVEMRSEILNENRLLNIYLPAGYSPDSAKTYPVIYLLDGSADEDFIHLAGLVQFCTFPWISTMPETIVVGIANVDRRRDFTYPTTIAEDKEANPTSGSSASFIRFIGEELQPFIEKNYTVSGDRTLIGQSLGGLLATEILITRADLFENFFIVSPSLWWDNGSLLEKPVDVDLSAKSIYIAVGDEGKEMVGPAKKLHKKINAALGDNTRLFYQYFKNRTHADILHEAIYDGFEKIFENS